jgi:plastocyanin
MKKHAIGVVVASFALLAGCSGGGEAGDAAESVAAEASEAAEPNAEESEPATEESTPATEESAAAGGATGESTVLIGSVGTEGNPEDFVINLTTEDGEKVTELPAGDYTIQVTDPATTHNFHLTGGSVDETTSVPETEDTTFEVTLEPGEYTYKCDPHPPMTGSFTVTEA